jgi:hypothetical protein
VPAAKNALALLRPSQMTWWLPLSAVPVSTRLAELAGSKSTPSLLMTIS